MYTIRDESCLLQKTQKWPWAPPGRGKGGHLTHLDLDTNFSHIITVAPRVEIQMHFWKRAKFAGSVGHPMINKMLSASRGLCPPDRGSAPGPHWGLCPQTRVIGSCSALATPQPLTPSATYNPPGKNPVGAPGSGLFNFEYSELLVLKNHMLRLFKNIVQHTCFSDKVIKRTETLCQEVVYNAAVLIVLKCKF